MSRRSPAPAVRGGTVGAGIAATLLVAVLAACGPPSSDELGRTLVDMRADGVAARMSDRLTGQGDGKGEDFGEGRVLAQAQAALDDDSRAYEVELSGSGLVVGVAFYEEFDYEGLVDPTTHQVVECREFRAPADDLDDVSYETVDCPSGTGADWIRSG